MKFPIQIDKKLKWRRDKMILKAHNGKLNVPHINILPYFLPLNVKNVTVQ